MKTLKYILSAIALMMAMYAPAQLLNSDWGQLPNADMQTTSVLPGSGTDLPLAAESGVSIVSTEVSPAQGPRRVNRGDNNGDPGTFPVGDLLWPMLLLALGYGAVVCARKKLAK